MIIVHPAKLELAFIVCLGLPADTEEAVMPCDVVAADCIPQLVVCCLRVTKQ